MKIDELYVDRFGVWRDLALASFGPGLNVIYGPNETGKSTLMRFIRGVLYGFGPSGPRLRQDDHSAAYFQGSLRITHDGKRFDVDRSAQRSGRGTLSIEGFDEDRPAEELIERLLSGTSEAMFQRLFAVDLLELQELATLGGEELSDRVYGLTLGPEGQSILKASTDLSGQRRELFDSEEDSGRLAEIFRRHDRLSAEIESAGALPERHAVLSHERDELNADVGRRKQRQLQLQAQQRGHRFLEQAWPAWNRAQELERALSELPDAANFPEDGLERLAKIDEETDSLTRCGKTLVAEARQLRSDSQALVTERQEQQQAAAIESLCEQRGKLPDLARQRAAAEASVRDALKRRDEAIGRLGADWSLARLESAETSPAAQLRLIDAARGYHGRLDRRGRIRRRYKLRAAACSRQSRELQERRKSAGGLTIDEQIEAAQLRLMQLEELGRLRASQSEFELRQSAIQDRIERLEDHPPLPAWAYAVLGIFAILGIVFSCVGFYTGLTFNGMMGLMYALLGIACGGTAYALKAHVETTVGESGERLSDELRDVEIILRETRSDIARLMSEMSLDAEPVARETPAADSKNDDLPLTDLMLQQARQLADLERAAETEQLNAARRNRLSEWRAKLKQSQRDVISSRQSWCAVLEQLGLNETLRVDEALGEWQRVLEAKETLADWQTTEQELAEARRPLDDLQQSAERLAGQIGWDPSGGQTLETLLNTWHERLLKIQREQAERRRWRRSARGRLREAAGYRRRIARCDISRTALLMQAGASNREEFEAQAETLIGRQDLEAELDAAQLELEAVCRHEPELAIVEEDMTAFDSRENAEQLEQIEADLERLEHELQQLFERLGSVKQEIAEVECDRRGTSLRFNRARVEDELKQAAEEWFALELSGRALDVMRQQFEQNHQPATLAAATKYLAQLTRGRYGNIWTPLGRQRLCVDDEMGRSFTVEQLSGGTREQLFLAIRLAIVDELKQRGIELPMVLDDVFANFDQSRTEAAVETLMEVADDGQQILLLTCHLHVAQLADSRGAHAIWLPEGCAAIAGRKAG